MALRNAFGVAIPLLAGDALHNPAGGSMAATGALNVSFTDGNDPYLHRAAECSPPPRSSPSPSSPAACAAAIMPLAITLEAACAFAAGMLVAAGQTAGDIGAITLVTLIVFSAEPASSAKPSPPACSSAAGGLLQTAPLDRPLAGPPLRPEARASPPSTLSLARDRGIPSPRRGSAARHRIHPRRPRVPRRARSPGNVESERYLALFNQAERMRLALAQPSPVSASASPANPGPPPTPQLLDRACELAARMLSSIAAMRSPQGVKSDPHAESLAELRNLAEDSARPVPRR